ncbi:hypothetical protein C8J56DRAFT_968893 [Mycena floridula]|nr:hypothetical protein C8J56DRAFT_968893 [Mycena floridula]
MSNPNAPPGESAADLYAEKGWLQGAIIGGVAYGVDLTLFGMCIHLLISQFKGDREARRRNLVLIGYIVVSFILVTLFMGSLAEYTQLAFIENRNYQGGPNAYEQDMFSIPVDELGNVAFVLSTWLSDLVIVWRCKAIFQGSGRFPLWIIMFLPGLIYTASVVLGVLWLIQISASSPWGDGSVNWTIPYLSTSLGLNILVTLAITSRLFLYRRRITKVLGNNYGSQYTSTAAMIVESAAIYSVFALLFLVPFAVNNALSEVFLQSLAQVQTATVYLIVYRVAQGRSWTSNTATQFTSASGGGSKHIGIPLSSLRSGNTTTAGGESFIKGPEISVTHHTHSMVDEMEKPKRGNDYV